MIRMRNVTEPNMSPGSLERVGDFYWSREHSRYRHGLCLTVMLPHPRRPAGMRARIWPREWGWDGNLGAPTLSKSLGRHTETGGMSWHGWMTNGYLVPI